MSVSDEHLGVVERSTPPLARIPPWRWSLWGPWPPGSSPHKPPPTDDAIRPRAEQLAQRRPWCTDEQNWADARLELNSPILLRWRPTFLRWLGASEKTCWDWMELSLKLSVPLTIAILGSVLGSWNNERQIQIADNIQKDAILSKYLERMESLILDKNLKKATVGDDVSSVARTLTLVSLSQLRGPNEDRTRAVLQFLQEAGLIRAKEVRVPLEGAYLGTGNFTYLDLSQANLAEVSFSQAHLSGTNFTKADLSGAVLVDADLMQAVLYKAVLQKAQLEGAVLREADLSEADLSGARLFGADLSEAVLSGANLRGADLRGAVRSRTNSRWTKHSGIGFLYSGANLSGADLGGILWDEKTKWPEKANFLGARNIPPKLKEQLGLN
jgi:uncharacterized protein YjbI with pentapeptide repeats